MSAHIIPLMEVDIDYFSIAHPGWPAMTTKNQTVTPKWSDFDAKPDYSALERTLKLPYHPLVEIFQDAVIQAADGKGMERHGTSKDFTEQPLYDIAKLTGQKGPMYQVFKKTHEAIHCLEKGTFTKEEAYTELLGALVYLGAMAHMVKDS